jgi:hypothetical protein
MSEVDQIYEKLCEITGPYREYSPVAQHKIYGSYHFPQFTRTDAWRNTLTRFDEFLITIDFTGKKITDLGSCLGSLREHSKKCRECNRF